MDKIEIRDLEIFANHGVFPEETALGQKFVVSAVMYTETRPAGLTDDLSASINYGEVSHMITDFLQKNTYKLLEAAVENLAELLLLSLPLLKKITLRIEKPWAPVGKTSTENRCCGNYPRLAYSLCCFWFQYGG